MHLSFPELLFSLSPPRNYIILAIFLDLWRPRLQVPQTMYEEGMSELNFRIHSFTCTWNPQETVKTSWGCICKCPMAKSMPWRPLFLFTKARPGQGGLWCRMSLLKLRCWTGAKFRNVHQLWRPCIYFPYFSMHVFWQLDLHFTLLKHLRRVTMVLFHGGAFQRGTAIHPELEWRLFKEGCQSCLCPGPPPVSWEQRKQSLPQHKPFWDNNLIIVSFSVLQSSL